MVAERVVAEVEGIEAGPTLIAIGAMHGNEPAGLEAIRRVATGLDPTSLRGRFVGWVGNRLAYARGVRYVDHDLNRAWTRRNLERLLHARPSQDGAEDREQRELIRALAEECARARGPVFLVDLHTTSASGYPFVLYRDTPHHGAFASSLPLVHILGLEEAVQGVLGPYAASLGIACVAVEGGQHDDPRSITHLHAALIACLAGAGCIPSATGEVPEARATLAASRSTLPARIVIRSRHAIGLEDGFRMEPGFANIAAVSRGTRLATDVAGPILAEEDGYVVLPLYQGLGSDGYFWGHAHRPSRRSRWARWVGLERWLTWAALAEADEGRLVSELRWVERILVRLGHHRPRITRRDAAG